MVDHKNAGGRSESFRRLPDPTARCRRTANTLKALSVVLLGGVCIAGAGTRVQSTFDAAGLPPALPATDKADTTLIVTKLEEKLPAGMSVIEYGRFVVAVMASREEAMRQGRHIARGDEQIRERAFPAVDARRTVVVLAANPSALGRLAEELYPSIAVSEMPPSGFYHQKDRLILATTTNGDAAVWAQLVQSLLRDYNPDAPYWLEQAAATLYESSEWRSGRLTPLLDDRMRDISPNEDLGYDVFAGICDCTPASAAQLALMRMLLVHLHQHDKLKALQAIIKEQGRYTTLLQALRALDFDHAAWKSFAERSVRAHAR